MNHTITTDTLTVEAYLESTPIRAGAYEMHTRMRGTATDKRAALIAKCNATEALAKKLLADGWWTEWVTVVGVNVTIWINPQW